MDAHTAVLKVGFDERMSPARTGLFGLQHLLALTGIWIFPVTSSGSNPTWPSRTLR